MTGGTYLYRTGRLNLNKLALAAIALTLTTPPAFAHVTLDQSEAPVGSTSKLVLRVPHGCDGQPTNAVRVQIPQGMIAVKPQPKTGWTLEKIKGAYDKPYDYYGTPMSEGVREIAWSGGNLPDDEYEEFVLRGYLSPELKAGSTLYFPVVQECAE